MKPLLFANLKQSRGAIAPSCRAGALVFVLMIGGCIASQGAPPFFDAQRPLVGFRAIFEEAGADGTTTQWRLTFDAPRSILDRDGHFRLAYPLSVSNPTNPPDFKLTYWLDEDLRVVRVDSQGTETCMHGQSGVCPRATVSWFTQGELAPWGLGLLRIMEIQGNLSHSSWTRTIEAEPDITFEGGLILVELIDSRISTVRQGRFTYDQGALLPTRIHREEADREPYDAALISFEPNDDLPAAESWPKSVERAPEVERAGEMFPGEQTSQFDLGFTPREALDWLLENVEPANQAMQDGGCVLGYRVTPRDDPPDPNSVIPQTAAVVDIQIKDREGKAWEWTLARQSGVFGGSFQLTATKPYEFAKASCTATRESPWPRIESSDFLDRAGDIQVSSSGRPHFWWLTGTFDEGPSGVPPSSGWHQYVLQYRPDYIESTDAGTVSYQVFAVGLEAHHGWWTSFSLHPRDLEALDPD